MRSIEKMMLAAVFGATVLSQGSASAKEPVKMTAEAFFKEYVSLTPEQIMGKYREVEVSGPIERAIDQTKVGGMYALFVKAGTGRLTQGWVGEAAKPVKARAFKKGDLVTLVCKDIGPGVASDAPKNVGGGRVITLSDCALK